MSSMFRRFFSASFSKHPTLPGVGYLTLESPSTLNSLSPAMIASISEITHSTIFRESTVVILSAKYQDTNQNTNQDTNVKKTTRVFCAGADLKNRLTMNENQVHDFVKKLRSTFDSISLGKYSQESNQEIDGPITIGVSDGLALGGGYELLLACDMIVLGSSPDVAIGLPEVKLGVIPGAGGTQRLRERVGVARAIELTVTGRRVGPDEAVRLGMAEKVAANPLQEAEAMATEIVKGAPLALKAARKAIKIGAGIALHEGLAIEEACYDQIIPTQDRTEGLKAFIEKRKPVYKGL